MNRIKYLDIARGIAIILMIMGHSDNFGMVNRFIGLYHIAIFIFISGYLFKDVKITTIKELIKFCYKKCKKLYFFYLRWEIIFFVLRNVFIKIGFLNTAINYSDKNITEITTIKDFFVGVAKIVIGMGREPFCGAFWFIISLIFITIMFACIKYITSKIKKEKLMTFVLSLICFAIGVAMYYIKNIPRLSPAFTLIIIYYLGNLYYMNKDRIKFDNLWVFLFSTISLLVLCNFGSISMNSNNIKDPIFFLICSIFGIYMVFYLSKFIESKLPKISAYIEYVGKKTLPIMALHFISFKIIMLIQLACNNITFEQLGILTGANNNNWLFIIYVIVGVNVPALLGFVNDKIISQIKNSRIYKKCIKT